MKKSPYYWNKERCKEEASKYKSKNEYRKNANGSYKAALKNRWLSEITINMVVLGSLYKRYNYIYEFPDKHVYIGLTCDINRRNYEHLNTINSPVFKHIEETNLKPLFKVDELKDVNEAIDIEIKTIYEYKNNGWVLLNKSKGGGVGKTNTKWTKNKAILCAFNYKRRIDFQKNSHTCYKFCLKNKIMDEVCSHMVRNKKTNIRTNKYTKEYCLVEAQKYKTKKDFYTKSQNIYRYCIRNKILSEACLHMIREYNKKAQ